MSDRVLLGFIRDLRVALAGGNTRAFATPEVKQWCARRWRDLFLDEAVKDSRAMRQASCLFDRRPARQRIAEYFFTGEDCHTWEDQQCSPDTPALRNTTLVVCPGLLNGLLPVLTEFRDELPRIQERFGMPVLHADSHPVRGCEANKADLLRTLDEGLGFDARRVELTKETARPPRDVVVIGYSKGAADLLTLLCTGPAPKARIRAIVTWAGAVGGSELADLALQRLEGKTLEHGALEAGKALKGLLPPGIRLGEYAGRRLTEFDTASALRDLSTSVRDRFLAEHAQTITALNIPIFTLAGSTKLSEVPYSQRKGFRTLSEADAGNDMQLTNRRAILRNPHAVHLANLRAHHWDLAYPSFVKGRWFGLNNTYHPFPKFAALAATLSLLAELGLID